MELTFMDSLDLTKLVDPERDSLLTLAELINIAEEVGEALSDQS
jgi:hypothetical protein